MGNREHRCLLVADFTISGLVPYLESADAEPPIRCVVAPFDQVNRLLLDESDECWTPRPDVAVIWTRPDAAVPSFARLTNGEPVDSGEITQEVDRFAQLLITASRRAGLVLVPTWTPRSFDRGLGLLNFDAPRGHGYQLLKMNARLAEAAAGATNLFLLDAARWVGQAGPRADSPKLWHMGKIAFGPEVLKRAAAEVKSALRAAAGRSRKLLVLDLDDTLWGGVVGDVGWEQLVLGGHDPVGEAFAAFQRALKALRRRGIVLAIVSKNTEAIALEAIDSHPEMVLRRGDFAAWRINWEDKAANLVALTQELNLGLDAVVFIDDNPAERARVRHSLPDVLTPEWPADRMLYEQALKDLDCFDAVTLSDEDRRRTEMYATERVRRESTDAATDMGEYLASLKLRVLVERLSKANLTRACQLLNKTNQLNLRTRRMTEADFWDWAQDSEHHTFTYRVEDRFGDYGLTGLASISIADGVARIEDFVLSCRVIGRGAEEVMLHTLVGEARTRGLSSVRAGLIPTNRNQPCRQFFEGRSGFDRVADADEFTWNAASPYLAPGHVAVELTPRSITAPMR